MSYEHLESFVGKLRTNGLAREADRLDSMIKIVRLGLDIAVAMDFPEVSPEERTEIATTIVSVLVAR